MKRSLLLFFGTILYVFSLVATALSGLPSTFDDTDRTVPPAALPGTPDLYSLPYPRLNLTDGTTADMEIASKYNTVSYAASQIHNAAALKEKYPRTMVLRYFISTSYEP